MCILDTVSAQKNGRKRGREECAGLRRVCVQIEGRKGRDGGRCVSDVRCALSCAHTSCNSAIRSHTRTQAAAASAAGGPGASQAALRRAVQVRVRQLLREREQELQQAAAAREAQLQVRRRGRCKYRPKLNQTKLN